MNNLEKSELVISMILAELMDRGIQDGIVDFTTLVGNEALKPFVGPCFRWLVSEGIVDALNDASSDSGVAMIDPTLTAYGFKLMGTELTVDGDQTKVGEFVKKVAKNGKTFSNVGELLGSALGAFTKSVGS